MPQTLLIFDFGSNEEAAQQARHRVEGWRQAFHLGDRLKCKFERQAGQAPAAASAEPPEDEKPAKAPVKAKAGKSKKKSAASESAPEPPKKAAADRLRLMVRLEFSTHEKLTYQRWLDRFGAEPTFQNVEKQVLARGQDGFESAAETFDSLP